MTRFTFRRLAELPFVLLGVSLLTFLLVRLVPVEPAEVILRLSNLPATDEAVVEVRAELGMDEPFYVQYGLWLSRTITFDFGSSYVSKLPIADEIAAKFPATLQLALSALLLTVLIGVPLGILSSRFHTRWMDRVAAVFMYIGAAMPRFWLGFLLLYVFSLRLDWLPSQGKAGLAHLILPSLTLALPQIAVVARLLRSQMLEQMRETFVLFGRFRGLGEGFILVRHVLRNALAPIVTVLGLGIGNMLGGTVIVEQVFGWPGMGRYLMESILNRDYPVIQCYVWLMAVVYVTVNLVADGIQRLLDPRAEYGEGKT